MCVCITVKTDLLKKDPENKFQIKGRQMEVLHQSVSAETHQLMLIYKMIKGDIRALLFFNSLLHGILELKKKYWDAQCILIKKSG